MAEYIERMTAISVACKGCNKEFPNDPCEPAECYIQQGLFAIPTADVVEVVRCKDCEYLMFSDMYGECGKAVLGIVSPNDYCSRGIRRRKGGGE
jgi:hypothetical protein